jgi:hypothetical protein
MASLSDLAACYTSVLPNLLIEGVAATIHGVNAVRIYVANLMTEPGRPSTTRSTIHLRVIRSHTGFELSLTTSWSIVGRSTMTRRPVVCRRAAQNQLSPEKLAALCRPGAGVGMRSCNRVGRSQDSTPSKIIGEGDSRARRGRTNDTSYSRAKDLITKKIAVLTGLEK